MVFPVTLAASRLEAVKSKVEVQRQKLKLDRALAKVKTEPLIFAQPKSKSSSAAIAKPAGVVPVAPPSFPLVKVGAGKAVVNPGKGQGLFFHPHPYPTPV